ncbi:beta-ketoacyl-[acyl-carrier-protein] synthase family protein [Arthrobacter sp. AFG7.2]|uniref:beta-ketoacyl-[acyl-carrier-protein] synthase family protein n=1 Tax=Arthrobacter sp. AFG7.2 TaxID=1688693 RepID=UPI000C9E1F66|nr:beta-ketoacyl-[acyl-carrier-protein] synthase family protein [Arthrobacter sp. AFG7.2]PNI08211.1 beta-ketoacyl-[acyl-carrier-protein] synthase family protein [Arthrobacter sp. AFG7.2]
MAASAIAVTGIGLVTPAGNSADTFWEAIVAGKSKASLLDGEEFAGHPVRLACRAVEPAVPSGTSAKELRRLDPFSHFALVAALDAFRDAGSPQTDTVRTAVVVGNAVGGRLTSDQQSRLFHTAGPQGVSPLMPLMTMPNAAAAMISMKLGTMGPALTVATTCASGADAIGHGMAMLRAGVVDVVIAGGCEATITPVTLAAFANLGALSGRNDNPGSASRPFDAGRDGFVMGEGAAFVVLERPADAQARGAKSYGHVLGYASTADAHHLAMPHPTGLGAQHAMRAALASAGVATDEIGHVNAHGTSTRLNDRIEADAISAVFGQDAPPVTATKGVTGHLLGAAGAAEAIATLLALRAGCVPPVANHTLTEQGIELDIVHTEPRNISSAPALSNSFGFGGHNACLVMAS